jgi:hypothetical protein
MTTTPGDSTKHIKLRPGERRAANGVIIGSGADPGIPRFGADETDIDYQPADQDFSPFD